MEDEDGGNVRAVEQVHRGQALRIVVTDGVIGAEVTELQAGKQGMDGEE